MSEQVMHLKQIELLTEALSRAREERDDWRERAELAEAELLDPEGEAELQAIYRQGHKDGYDSGYGDGYDAGYDYGKL